MLNRLIAPSLSFVLVVGSASVAGAATPVIGMASAQSGALLDNAKVSGNATVFEGSTLQSSGYSRVHLSNGSRLDLAAGSKAQVFANHVSLEQGMSEVQSSTGFEIDARTLKIQPTSSTSIARVKLDGDKQVFVTALNSPVNVLNKDGMLVARVAPGLPLSFMPQAGAGTAFDSTGCVLVKGGAAILVDSSGNQVTEIRGLDLRKAVGNTTQVTGMTDSSATPAGGASSVVKASKATVTKKGGCSTVATKVGASTAAAGLGAAVGAGAAGAGGAAVGAAAAGTAAGLSTAAVVGISVAAATAAAVGGAAAAGTFSSSSK
jgi:hypothetical protein